MKNSLEFTKDILTDDIQHDISPCDNFVPFLVQKYISGISPTHCSLINDLLNTKLSHWNSSQEIYDFLKIIIPKTKVGYIKYYRSSKEVNNKNKVDIQYFSDLLEISKKEVLEMLNNFPEIEKTLLENNEKILKAKK